jgi:mono/diheme cytochrome c family protein
MFKLFLILATLLLFGFPAVIEGSQQPDTAAPATDSKAPADATSRVNPVHATPASLARAKQIYGFDCALCHGADGSGKGDVASDTKLPDYRDPAALKGLSDGEIYYIIDKGKGSMPPEDGRAKPDELWNLVIYLRSLSKGQAAVTASQGPT